MCWRDIVKLFVRQPVNFPVSKGTISSTEVFNIIKANFGLTDDINISDNSFDLCSIDDAFKYLESKAKVPYVGEGHDCDNFSFASMGYFSEGLYSFAYGILWSSNHAFNFMIDADKKLWIVEPQSNKFYTIEEAKEASKSGPSYYPVRFALC